jgi:hypothetical protein
LILLGWGWALLNGAAFTLAQPDYVAQLAPLVQAFPGLAAQAAALALVPALPGLDSQMTAGVLAVSGVVIALLGHAWPAGRPTSRGQVARDLAAIANAMLRFANDREREDRAVQLTGDAFFDSEALATRSRETVTLYQERFGAEIAWAQAALERFGLGDPAFEAACEHPDDAEGIRVLGTRLSKLGRELRRSAK